jgi:hypothetical protein
VTGPPGLFLKKVAIRFSSRRIFSFARPKRRLGLSSNGGGFDMAKSDPKEIELVPDAWERFERFIKQIAKAGPQHKMVAKKAKKPKKKPGK